MNTLGHSVCAIGIYLLWWHKPLDIEQPVPIKGKEAERLLAFFWMTTDGLPITYRGEREGEAEMRYLSICLNENGQLPTTQARSQPSVKKITKSGRHLYRPSAAEQLSGISQIQKLPWRSDKTRSEVSNVEKMASIKLGKGGTLVATSIRNEYEDIILKQEDIRRWQIAEEHLREDLSRRTENDDWQATITDRSKNWPSIDVDPKTIDWSLLLAFNISGILYGGLHMLAWNAKFATDLQGGLWRLASCFIIGFVPASTLVLLTEKLFFAVVSAKSVGHKPTKKFSESFFNLMYRYKIWLALFFLGLLAYLWARVYLVVECFISLFHSPDGVYNLPPWSVYMPHIT